MNNALYKHRLTVGVTEKMNDLLEDLAISRTRKDSPVSKADLIREHCASTWMSRLMREAPGNRSQNLWNQKWRI